MKAAQINDYGDTSAINVVEIEKPTVQDGQVIVEVHASSLNPFDSAVRSGYMAQMIPLQLPVTIGGDIAGTIVEVGAGVENVAVGDTIYGQANVVAGNSGAFAEFAATSAGQVAKAPSNLTIQEAASLPLVGVSALQGLTTHIGLQSGQKLFVTGGAGGIGQVAIQIAKHLGAYVATTASGEGIEVVKSLGADEVIDYKAQDYKEILSDYDAVLDTVGGENLNDVLVVLKRDGIAVTLAGKFDEAKVEAAGVTALSQGTQVTTDALNELTALIESGVVKPSIGKVFTLNDIQAAFTTRETGEVKGKIVIDIKQ
jgi:NADPH:quinone reductase-like Zn-dependent oxidoreductase